MTSDPTEQRIHADDAGQRLDRFLQQWLALAPKALLQRWIRTGLVRIDGHRAEPGTMLEAGQLLQLPVDRDELTRFQRRTAGDAGAESGRTVGSDSDAAPPGPGPRAPLRQPPRRPLTIRHRDADVWIVDKPAGLAVQGGTGLDDDLQSRIRAHVEPSAALTFQPSPAHRLDRPTSGLLMVGVSARGLRGLHRALRDHQVGKVYFAIVEGRPDAEAGIIDARLRTDDRTQDGLTVVDESGLEARTRYRSISHTPRWTAVRIALETGRRHQIRAHFAALGHPIVGDIRYGAARHPGFGMRRIALHAERLILDHPVDGSRLDVRSPIPPELQRLLPG